MKAVFVDRDGTIIRDLHYLSTPDGIRFLEGALPGLRILRESGFGIFIVTNQSGVGRGFLSLERLQAINRELLLRLSREGVRVKGIYFCPHHPKEGCTCRKPKPRLALRILREFPEIDLKMSATIGDKPSDLLFGEALGTKRVLISRSQMKDERADFVARNLKEAALWLR